MRFPAEGSGVEAGDMEGRGWGSWLDPGSGDTYSFFGCDAVGVKK